MKLILAISKEELQAYRDEYAANRRLRSAESVWIARQIVEHFSQARSQSGSWAVEDTLLPHVEPQIEGLLNVVEGKKD
jgi:hypothetical protein